MSDSARHDGSMTQFILPPLWHVIPLGDETDAAVDALMAEQYAGLPRDKYGPEMRRLREAVVDSLAGVVDTGALEVIFPLGNYWGAPVSIAAVTAVAEVDEQAPADYTDELMLDGLAVELGGERVETDAGPAVRTEEIPDPAEAPEGESSVPLRTIAYYWQVPGGGGATFTLTSTISGPEDPEIAPLVAAFVELNDAMAQAMTWRHEVVAAAVVGTREA